MVMKFIVIKIQSYEIYIYEIYSCEVYSYEVYSNEIYIYKIYKNFNSVIFGEGITLGSVLFLIYKFL